MKNMNPSPSASLFNDGMRDRLRSYSIGHRMRFSAIIVLCLMLRPLLTVLWWIDNWLWPGYADVEVKAPVFIVAGARTGSTRLHEVMAHAGGTRFISFTLVQFFSPYLTGQWMLSLIQRFDQFWLRGLGHRFFRSAERKAIPTDMQLKHDIKLDNTEEDEWWFVFWHLTSVFATHLLPSPITSLLQFDYIPVTEQDEVMAFYKACVKKLLYRTGGEACFLSKSHGILCVAAIKRCFPDARFVTAIRDPRDSLPSYLSLRYGHRAIGGHDESGHRDSALKMFCGVSACDKELIEWQSKLDINYYETELREVTSSLGPVSGGARGISAPGEGQSRTARRRRQRRELVSPSSSTSTSTLPPSHPLQTMVLGAARPRNLLTLRVVGFMILPILMVIAGLLVGYVLFMLVICQFTKPRAPTFIDPNYIDPWVIVSRRRWGSPSWGGKYGDWHVVFYEDLLEKMEETILRVFVDLGIHLDDEGRRRLKREALHQREYKSKHVTSTLLSTLGYGDPAKFKEAYGSYMNFFLPAHTPVSQ